MELLFWVSAFLLVYAWVIYPSLLTVLGLVIDASPDRELLPVQNVTVIVPVYNGERVIEKKIDNIRELAYPQEQIEIIIVSDGSTDRTADIVKELNIKNVKLLETGERLGKSAAQNLGVKNSNNSIILFTDVEAVMEPDSLSHMIGVLGEDLVGCVGANVKFSSTDWQRSDSPTIYQRIEENIRRSLSLLDLLISINGSAFLVKKQYYRKLDLDTGDDFIIPLDLALQGYKTKFAENAIVHDFWPGKNVKTELDARSRITLRNFTGLLRRRSLLNPFKYPGLSFSLVSHKVLRWLSPVLMLLAFFTNFLLLDDGYIYEIMFAIQLMVYLVSVIGLVMHIIKIRIPVLGHLGMFLLANAGIGLGLLGLLRGDRISSYKS